MVELIYARKQSEIYSDFKIGILVLSIGWVVIYIIKLFNINSWEPHLAIIILLGPFKLVAFFCWCILSLALLADLFEKTKEYLAFAWSLFGLTLFQILITLANLIMVTLTHAPQDILAVIWSLLSFFLTIAFIRALRNARPEGCSFKVAAALERDDLKCNGRSNSRNGELISGSVSSRR
jgi:hypothetical protein